MRKRPSLLKTIALASAILVGARSLDAVGPDDANSEPSVTQGVNSDLVVAPPISNVSAEHRSHTSHRSHRSHASHRSHRSHYSGY